VTPTAVTTARTTPLRLLRFDRVQLATHWLNATLFGVLIATAIPLYFGSLFGAVLPRHLVEMIHLWSGLALPLPIIVSLIGPWGAQMRRDVKRFNYWTRDEVNWIRTMGKSRVAGDKFNPGQKLNAIFVGATVVVLLVSGSMLQWFRFFPVMWRVGATFTHDLFALAVVIVIVGHVALALTHPKVLKAIFTGTITEGWAKTNAPLWLEEVTPSLNATPPVSD
jgi:formate dehydrogenase subunit gamma